MTTKRVARIKSHRGHALFLASLNEAGAIPRQPDIPSPYAFSLEHAVYTDVGGRRLFVVETAHRQYDVFQVLD